MSQKVLYFPSRWLRAESTGILRSYAVGSNTTDDLSVRLEGRPGLNWTLGWQSRALRRLMRRSQHRASSGTGGGGGFHTTVTEFWSDPKITRPPWWHAAVHGRLSTQELLWLESGSGSECWKRFSRWWHHCRWWHHFRSGFHVMVGVWLVGAWSLCSQQSTIRYWVTDAVRTQPGLGLALAGFPALQVDSWVHAQKKKSCACILVRILLAQRGHGGTFCLVLETWF